MAALTDLSDLINRMSGGSSGAPESVFFYKPPRVAGAAATAPILGRGCSLWTYDGFPAGGTAPGAAAIPTRSTQGAIPFTAPAGGTEKFLISAGLTSLTQGVFILYDRLFHISGLSGASTASQTVQGSPATPALTRNTGGAGNMVFYELYGQVGGTSTTLTMTYTNQAGTGSRTSTINIGGTGFREVTRMQRIPLAAGDTGVQSVQSVQLTASTASAGDIGITIAQPIAWIPCGNAGIGGWRDFTTGLPSLPVINTNACLALHFIPGAATATEVFGALSFVEK